MVRTVLRKINRGINFSDGYVFIRASKNICPIGENSKRQSKREQSMNVRVKYEYNLETQKIITTVVVFFFRVKSENNRWRCNPWCNVLIISSCQLTPYPRHKRSSLICIDNSIGINNVAKTGRGITDCCLDESISYPWYYRYWYGTNMMKNDNMCR